MMREAPEQYLLAEIRKCGGAVTRGLITAREFINKVFDEFAHVDRVCPEVIPPLWEAIPNAVRGEFEAAIREAARPEFRYRPFYIRGARPMTDEELRRDAELRTERVRAWALAFVRFLDTARPKIKESSDGR